MLLQETAQRHMNAERSIDGKSFTPVCYHTCPRRSFNPHVLAGLVISNAQYGPAEADDAAEGLTIDVTVPIQALVSKSQLYIPGRRSKVRLRPRKCYFVTFARDALCSQRIHLCFGSRLLGTINRRGLCVCLPHASPRVGLPPSHQVSGSLQYDWWAFTWHPPFEVARSCCLAGAIL